MRKGVVTTVFGIAGAIASGSAIVASAGAATPLTGMLFIESLSQSGIGLSLIIDGIVSSPSEQTEYVKENMPTSISNALAKSADEILETTDHPIENASSIITSLMTISSKGSTAADHIQKIGAAINIANTANAITTKQDNLEKSESNVDWSVDYYLKTKENENYNQ